MDIASEAADMIVKELVKFKTDKPLYRVLGTASFCAHHAHDESWSRFLMEWGESTPEMIAANNAVQKAYKWALKKGFDGKQWYDFVSNLSWVLNRRGYDSHDAMTQQFLWLWLRERMEDESFDADAWIEKRCDDLAKVVRLPVTANYETI